MTPISEIIFSGFVSKVVNDIIDVSKAKIRRAVRNRSTKHQNIESQIYNVIVDVLNIITNNQYKKNQDSIYDAAVVLLESFKENDEDKLKSIKSCLRVLDSPADKNGCLKFEVSLYEELSKEGYSELFRAILLLLLDQKNQYDYVVYQQLHQKLDEVNLKIDELDQKLDDIQKKQEDIIILDKVVRFQNNKKQKYIENWNSRLFLHVDNKENPITLKDAFIMPNYKMHKSITRMGFLKDDTLDQIIEKFVNYDKTSTMLITGVPGIGKSSIVSWIANQYKNDDRIIVLRFRDWKKKELANGLLYAIYDKLHYENEELEGKILILDGFDEMKNLDIRDTLLDIFFNNIKDFENFKCIITSRPAYINSISFNNVLELREFDIKRVESFYRIITGNGLDKKKKIESNLEVLGIPVILYMAIMSNIDISKNPTKPELYNRIFAEEGGIFDKFSYDGKEYDIGDQVLRDSQNIKTYLVFLQEIAFRMFEKDEIYLLKEEYQVPELKVDKETISILEFPIKHLFEGAGTNIEFVHKSIYEFFVSEYIYSSISSAKNASKEKLAGVFGKIFNQSELSEEILEFLRDKICNSEPNDMFDIVYDAFQLMSKDGMTYYTGICYKNVIACEINVFRNMLNVIHLWKEFFGVDDLSTTLFIHHNKDLWSGFIKTGLGEKDDYEIAYGEKRGFSLSHLNLSNTNLSGKDLSNMDFSYADLSNSNLRDADLVKANLRNANLNGADLRGAKLAFANLDSADLRNADLRDADLSYASLYDTDLYYVDLSNTVITGANLSRADLRGTILK